MLEHSRLRFSFDKGAVNQTAKRAAKERADPINQMILPKPAATAGPKTRAGFMAAPVSGPPNKMSSVIVDPITRPATARGPRPSTATP